MKSELLNKLVKELSENQPDANSHPEINDLESAVEQLMHKLKGEGKGKAAEHLQKALNELINANHAYIAGESLSAPPSPPAEPPAMSGPLSIPQA